jgi:nucleoside-diphosphate-sugar epimerase
MSKNALVFGAGGFIGSHMVTRLKQEGYSVVGADLKNPDYSATSADKFILADLSDRHQVLEILNGESIGPIHEIYQFAADMGGAGYIFTGDNDLNVMENSASINLSLIWALIENYKAQNVVLPKVFYSSSACIYPQEIQTDSHSVDLKEEYAYPANPDSEYGWEKLFSERLYFAFARNYGAQVRVARFHNIYGPNGTWDGGREKAPAAICRKVYLADEGGVVEVWGSGQQSRSFLYIEDCIEAVRRFMEHPDFSGPLNIGSEEMVTLNQLVEITASVANKNVTVKNVSGPVGVLGRNSNNSLVREKLNWDYSWSLEDGIKSTYDWIGSQIEAPNLKP